MLLAALLLMAGEPPPAPADPFRSLKSTVVDAIRNCGVAEDGQIRVCARDRGFAEVTGNRLPELKKPKPVDEGPIRFEMSGGNTPPPPPPPPGR